MSAEKGPLVSKPATSGATLVDAIRDLVIAGELAPGSRVTEPLLANRFGVSRVPIREALRVLATEGLIDLKLYGSPTVRQLTDHAVDEVRAARNIVEPATAREAALNRSDADLEKIDAVLAEGDRALERGELMSLHRLNSRFHDAVASACGNEILATFVHVLSSRSEWVNTLSISATNRPLWQDHHEIRMAIAAGDAPLAEALMLAHVRRAASSVLDAEPSSTAAGS